MPWTGDPSIRDLILDNVVTTLAGITVAGGYELDVFEATRVVRDIEDEIITETPPSETPLHQVLAGLEKEQQIGSSGLIRARFAVVDWLVVAFDDIERAVKDTKIAMRVDKRRGTHPTTSKPLALDTHFEEIETAEGIFYPFELIRIEWQIHYTYLEGAP